MLPKLPMPHGSCKILKSPQNTTRGITSCFVFFTHKPRGGGPAVSSGDTQVQSSVSLNIFGHLDISWVTSLLPGIRRDPTRLNTSSETSTIVTGRMSSAKRCCGWTLLRGRAGGILWQSRGGYRDPATQKSPWGDFSALEKGENLC